MVHAPMGSPLSPVIANLFMEDLAEQAMHTSTRCLSTNIQFTIEKEEEGRLAFLDVLMIHSKDQLSTTVYRKPTHTDRYIPYHSHHHPRMLTGVMRGMRDRALRICDNTSRQAEMEHLARVFEANGCPEKLVRKTLTKPQRQQTCEPDEEEPPKTLQLPYICERSQREDREDLWTPWRESYLQAPKYIEAAACESEAEDAGREEEGSGLPGSLQGLPQGIHWGDQENTKEQNK